MKSVGESILQGGLTMFERIVLNTMISYFILHGFEVTEDNMLSVYNKVSSKAHSTEFVEFPLSNLLSRQKISQFLKRLNVTLQLLVAVILKK